MEEEVVEQKKVKFDKDQQLEETASSALKRYSSDILENETKRTKPNGLLSEDEDSEMSNKEDVPEDCDMLSSKEGVSADTEVIPELKKDKSNGNSENLEIEETTCNSTLKTLEDPQVEKSLSSLDGDKFKIAESADSPVKELLNNEESAESAAKEPTKDEENSEPDVEEPSAIVQKSTDAEVEGISNAKSTLELVVNELVTVEENSNVPVQEELSEVKKSLEVSQEFLSKEELSSIVEKLSNTEVLKEKAPKEEEVKEVAVVQEKSDIQEVKPENPMKLMETTTKKVDEHHKESKDAVQSETKTEESAVKQLASSESSKLSINLPPVSSKTESENKISYKEKTTEPEEKTSKRDGVDAVINIESKGNVTEVDTKVSKEDKSLCAKNKESTEIVVDGTVGNKITYKLTPIDTEPVVKKQRVLTQKENEPNEKKTVNDVKPKPESESRKVVEEKKTYTALEPMKVYPPEEEHKQTPVTSKVDSSKRKLPTETPVEAKTASDHNNVTNLDKAIESVVKKSRCSMFMVLKKFHKSQLRKMTRSVRKYTIVAYRHKAIVIIVIFETKNKNNFG